MIFRGIIEASSVPGRSMVGQPPLERHIGVRVPAGQPYCVMTSDRLKLLRLYCRIARPIMLRYLSLNSCIAASRVTDYVLRAFGFETLVRPVKFVVTVPSLERAFSAGLSAEELATANRSIAHPEWKGWNGHLITLVENHFIVDASFDQAGDVLKLRLDHEVFMFPMTDPPEHFHAQFGARLEDGTEFTVDYVTTTDESYRDTPAWNDKNLPEIATLIVTEMSHRWTAPLLTLSM